MIVDYLGCTQVNPTSILPSFHYERFQGKDIGKLLINLIQIISNELNNGIENVVMLKCTDKVYFFINQLVLKLYKNHQNGRKIKRSSIIMMILKQQYLLEHLS